MCMAMLIATTGCMLFEEQPKMGQAAIKNFETRIVDASFNDVYAASTEAFFDLGYTIAHSDKASGIVVGEKRHKKRSEWTWIDGKFTKRPDSEVYEMLQLTILVKEESALQSKVRIKTSVNKQRELNKRAVNEIWLYIERQVLMEEAPRQPTATPADANL